MLPRDISAGAARRRALLFDALAGVAIALVVIALSAGLGIVGAIALITLLVLAVGTLVETALRRLRSSGKRGRTRRRPPASSRRRVT